MHLLDRFIYYCVENGTDTKPTLYLRYIAIVCMRTLVCPAPVDVHIHTHIYPPAATHTHLAFACIKHTLWKLKRNKSLCRVFLCVTFIAESEWHAVGHKFFDLFFFVGICTSKRNEMSKSANSLGHSVRCQVPICMHFVCTAMNCGALCVNNGEERPFQ